MGATHPHQLVVPFGQRGSYHTPRPCQPEPDNFPHPTRRRNKKPSGTARSPRAVSRSTGVTRRTTQCWSPCTAREDDAWQAAKPAGRDALAAHLTLRLAWISKPTQIPEAKPVLVDPDGLTPRGLTRGSARPWPHKRPADRRATWKQVGPMSCGTGSRSPAVREPRTAGGSGCHAQPSGAAANGVVSVLNSAAFPRTWPGCRPLG